MNSRTIAEELQRNKDMRRSDLESLKKWVASCVHLPLDAADLALFLHRNHYDLEETKTNIENYFRMRSLMPEFFADRDPLTSDGLKQIFENVSVVVLPKRTPEGYAVVLFQLLNYEPSRYDFAQAVKYLNMALDVHVYEEGTGNGYLYVCDVKGSTPEHLDRLPVQALAKFFQYLKTGAHFRWKGLHYVNTDADGAAINDYVKAKIVDVKFDDNIYFHEKVEDMGKAVPLEMLPIEMGGCAGSLESLHMAQIKKIKEYRPWFKLEAILRINEATFVDENNINKLNKLCNNKTSIY